MGNCQICGKFTNKLEDFSGRMCCVGCAPKKKGKLRKPIEITNPRPITNQKTYQPLGEAECDECGTVFMKRMGLQRYCSRECALASQNRGTFIIFQRDGFTCFYCGQTSFEDGVELHLEHLIAVSNNGKSIAENLVTACSNCNLEKHTKEIKRDILERMQVEIKKRNWLAGIQDGTKIKSRASNRDETE